MAAPQKLHILNCVFRSKMTVIHRSSLQPSPHLLPPPHKNDGIWKKVGEGNFCMGGWVETFENDWKSYFVLILYGKLPVPFVFQGFRCIFSFTTKIYTGDTIVNQCQNAKYTLHPLLLPSYLRVTSDILGFGSHQYTYI